MGRRGAGEAGLQQLRESFAHFEAAALTWLGFGWYLLADLLQHSRDLGGAASAIARASAMVEDAGFLWLQGEVLRLRGVIAARRGRTAEAERCLDTAVRHAQDTGSILFGSRAVIDRALGLMEKGRSRKACQMLAALRESLPAGYPHSQRKGIERLLEGAGLRNGRLPRSSSLGCSQQTP
jgi:hypothetical protein